MHLLVLRCCFFVVAFFTSWERCVMMSPVHVAHFSSVMVRHCDSAVLMCTYLRSGVVVFRFYHFLGNMCNDVTCTHCTVSFLEGETL